MGNDELFKGYHTELTLKTRNPRNLRFELSLLERFREFLADRPPTAALAKAFIATYIHLAPGTVLRYATTIKGFMKFCGDPIDDLKLRRPRKVPEYIKDSDIDKLLAAIPNKRSHKDTIPRDRLMVKLDLLAGLRRGELANLEVRDVHSDFLMVRSGKGMKDRVVPLPSAIARELNDFCRGRDPTENVFGLGGASLSNKIRQFAKKAGVDIHAHSLRHKYAQHLMDSGANLREVQTLLGHEDLNTTQVYLGVSDKDLRRAVERLEEPKPTGGGPPAAAPETLTASLEAVVRPAPFSLHIPTKSIRFFPLEVAGDELILESLQAVSSEPAVPFELMLFANDPDQMDGAWEHEDLIRMEPVDRRIYLRPLGGLRVNLSAGTHRIYVGFSLSARPIDFRSPDFEPGTGLPRSRYFEAPVNFQITLHYRLA